MGKVSASGSNVRPKLFRLLVLAALILFPATRDLYLIQEFTQYIIYGIFAMSLSLLWGYTGILCFGHAVFFGIGAYIMALVTKGMIPGMTGVFASSWMGILCALIGVAIFAVVLGYFLFYGRLSGPYLGVVTLTIAIVAERVATKWYYIGGFNGINNVPPLSFFGFEISNTYAMFYCILFVAILLYLFCDRLVRSPFGIILTAIRDNENRAEFFGYNIALYKIVVFTVGAVIAGLAGSFFASFTEFVSPTIVGFVLSTEVLIWVALGGKEVLLAAFLGAILVRVLEAYLSDMLAYYWILILGTFFVICVMFFPKGIFGALLAEKKHFGK
jgi:urea transport system permease protein